MKLDRLHIFLGCSVIAIFIYCLDVRLNSGIMRLQFLTLYSISFWQRYFSNHRFTAHRHHILRKTNTNLKCKSFLCCYYYRTRYVFFYLSKNKFYAFFALVKKQLFFYIAILFGLVWKEPHLMRCIFKVESCIVGLSERNLGKYSSGGLEKQVPHEVSV